MPWIPVSGTDPVKSGRVDGSIRPPSSASRWWSGLRRKRLTLRRGLDQAVAAVAAAVDDVDLPRLIVAEDEEVVSDQLELQHRLLGAHRLDGELLRLDDLRACLLVGAAHRTSGRGDAVSTSLSTPALGLVVLDLAQQLVG